MKMLDLDPSLRQNIIVIPTDGLPIIIELNGASVVPVEGCPVANGGPACDPRCGGGWPATKFTDSDLTFLVNAQLINPNKLGCEPQQHRAAVALQKIREGEKVTL